MQYENICFSLYSTLWYFIEVNVIISLSFTTRKGNMRRRKLTALIMCIMSLNLVTCSNTDNTKISKEQIDENTVSSEINKEKNLFDEVEINKEKELFDKAVIIADDDIARVKITGKEKVTPGNSIGYIFSI